MAATINTNIASINAQRNLTFSGQSLNTTMQRLSSGLRVNSAKDDAAGLAISERMNTQVKGLTVASRNASDGISLAQTTEGALGKIGDMLQRMRELAVQAGNATNSKSDRQALQLEVKQLADEVDRVAKQTNFNGQKVLDGSFAGAVFQVGANSGDNITLGALVDTRSEKISNIAYAQIEVSNVDTLDSPTNPTLANYGLEATGLEIQVITPPPGQTVSLPDLPPASSRQERLGQVIEAINNKSADTGVVAYLTKQEGSEEYTVEIMSGKTDTNGDPVQVTFAGFSASATGILNATGTIGGSTAGTAGAEIDASDIKKLMAGPEILYLAEMMNWPGVLLRDPLVMDKIHAAKQAGKPIDGHAPGLLGEEAVKTILNSTGGSLRRLDLIVTQSLIIGAKQDKRIIDNEVIYQTNSELALI